MPNVTCDVCWLTSVTCAVADAEDLSAASLPVGMHRRHQRNARSSRQVKGDSKNKSFGNSMLEAYGLPSALLTLGRGLKEVPMKLNQAHPQHLNHGLGYL